ncbi:MAG TPA: 50S ribosomal protein L9 [Acidimicrobiia bacterium]|jgi:large subunit ribosomal protein L9|nr:50S ribosomal protein L9 [Acidimicrobiia bacterium]
MRLILTSDVPELGKKGDVVDVSEGYGRNFLLPRKKAVKATEGAVRTADAMRKARDEAEQLAREQAERIATQLVGTRVVLAAQAGDEGKLYGSIGIGDVVEGIRKFTGVEVDRKTVVLGEPIRAIGLHEIQVKLHPEVEFPITLDVIPA